MSFGSQDFLGREFAGKFRVPTSATPFAERGHLSRGIFVLALCSLLLCGCPAAPPPDPPKPGVAQKVPAADKQHSTEPANNTPMDKAPPMPPNVAVPNPPRTTPVAPASPDAAKKFEPLFVDWEKPTLALVLTGRQSGYIEPCGCTGLENQKGGLARRFTLFDELKAKGWPLLALDVGNQVKRVGRQSELKFQIAVEGLSKMDYRAIGIGPDDLKLSSGELLAAIGDVKESRFVSANVAVLDESSVNRFQVFTVGGKKIGVTTVLGDEYRSAIKNDELILTPAVDALQRVAPSLAAANCDTQVLLAYASMDESKKLAQRFPQFQLIVTTGGAEEPAFEPEPIAETKSRLIQVGGKGMFVGVVGLFGGDVPNWRYQRVPLDNRFADAPAMLELLAAYQTQLKQAGLENLVARPVPHPSGAKFVGSEKCGECHTKAMDVWKKSPHAHATESLIHPPERTNIPRHLDPECLSCHITGWEPQKIFPFASGFESLTKSPHLLGSGCENCHGPGSNHVAAENGEAPHAAMRDQLLAAMRLPLANAQNKCVECHDIDNSPKFHAPGAFEAYWKRIAHPGKD